jgi:hypothetical protein
MKHRIIFGIIKTYKGIFSKRHIGNVQVIIIEMSKSFLMLNVIGQSKDDSNKHIAQMLLKGPSKFSNDFIDAFEEEGKFIQLEETLCDIPYENTDNCRYFDAAIWIQTDDIAVRYSQCYQKKGRLR